MKIVIAYTSAGSGHVKAAEAIQSYFSSRDAGHDIQLIDVLEESPFLFRKAYASGYSFLVSHAQWLWKLLFHITAQRKLQPTIDKMRKFQNQANVRNFVRFVLKSRPDVIICTHFLPAAVVSYMKEANQIRSRLVTVITDFGVHPFWLYDSTDLYCVASTHTRKHLIELGAPEDKIKVTGIPIGEKFQKKYDRESLCEKLGLAPDIVLLMTGSFGIGPLERVVASLNRHAQLLVVCARNKRLFKKLNAKRYAQTRVFGLVENIEELMSVSDMIITKPGGLSIAELLCMELPPVFISAIPGQEHENVKILEEYGIGESVLARPALKKQLRRRVGRTVVDAFAVKRKVLEYIKHPQKLKDMKEKIRRIKKPYAAEELYREVC